MVGSSSLTLSKAKRAEQAKGRAAVQPTSLVLLLLASKQTNKQKKEKKERKKKGKKRSRIALTASDSQCDSHIFESGRVGVFAGRDLTFGGEGL